MLLLPRREIGDEKREVKETQGVPRPRPKPKRGHQGSFGER